MKHLVMNSLIMAKKIHFKVHAVDFLTVKMLITAVITATMIAAIMTKKKQTVIIVNLIMNSLAAIAITKPNPVLPVLLIGQP